MGEDHAGEPQANHERLTVAQAAVRLGITEGAVRSRIKRGTLPTSKEGGNVFVLLGGSTAQANQTTNTGVPVDQAALIEALRDQIEDLRRERNEWREQARMTDRLLSAAMERIPAIEAPREPSETAETVEQEPAGAEPRSDAPGAQEPVERPQQRSAWRTPVDKLPWWQYLLALGLIAGLGVLITSEFFYARVHAALGPSIAIDLVMISLLWASPGIIGFWVGLKHRNLRLWRHLVPFGTTVGATAVVAVVPQSLNDIGVPGSGFAGPGDFALAITVLVFIPALILYMSGAIIGRAFQRRTALTLDTEALPSAPRLSAPGDGWSPKKQALLGFSGTVVAALISVIGQLVIAGSGGGG